MKKYTVFGLLSIGMFISQACKKEYVDKIREIAGDTVTLSGYQHISSFDIPEYNPDTALTATITGDSIIIYWPAYKSIPDSIHPTIILPANTSILPASGKGIAFKDGVQYIVTSQAGTTTTYTLHINTIQQLPYFEMLGIIDIGRIVQVNGDFLIPDTSRTKVTLIAASDSTEYAAEVTRVLANKIYFIAPVELPVDKYDIKVVNGKYTLRNRQESMRYNVDAFSNTSRSIFSLGYPFNLQKGDTFELRGLRMQDAKAAAFVDNNDNLYPLDLVQVVAQDRVKLKVSNTIPVGTYKRIYLFLTPDQGVDGDYIHSGGNTFNISE